MIQTLNTRVPQTIPAVLVKPCPFCKAEPYWLEVEHQVPESGFNSCGWKSEWKLCCYHPGVATDKDCILCGRGFTEEEIEKWNTRFE